MGNFFGSCRKSKQEPSRKALLIGIEYLGLQPEVDPIPAARTDAEYWKQVLRGCTSSLPLYGYPEDGIRLITDSAEAPLRPSYDNIVEGMKWLVDGVKAGDKRFLFVGCHGQQIDEVADGGSECSEIDLKDESIVTTTRNPGGELKTLVDNEIRKLVVDPLVKGSKLTAVIDTCHSGTLLDLPFRASVTDDEQLTFSHARADAKKTKKTKGTVVCVAACADGEKAYQFTKGDASKGEEQVRDTTNEVGGLTLAMREYFDASMPNGGIIRSPVPVQQVIQHLRQSKRLKQQTPW
ncbi:hypothetical protein FRB99_000678 [Tulasnella sp. 403]|nr:hypothetical protein FRB99_000678 [Tulasnella sp. 403]